MATGSNGRGNPTEPKPQGLFVVSPPVLSDSAHGLRGLFFKLLVRTVGVKTGE